MEEKRFDVYNRSRRIAENMTLEDVFIFIEARIDKYWEEPADYSIKELDRCIAKE